MNQNKATCDFIHEHDEADVRQLALKGTKDPDVDLPFALEQIAGRQKARSKLPSWAAIDGIVYPPHLSMEQCSSEQAARYKASLSAGGRRLVDLTGGFGVDFSFLASSFEQAIYVERQPQLCAISSENFRTLGLANAEVVCADGIDYLHALDHADLIFIDPARRDSHGARTYGIADCSPNLIELKDELKAKADCLLIKLSPMLDWRKAVADIGDVSEVHIVSVDNECKELLIEVKSESAEPTLRVACVNILAGGTEERFDFDIPLQSWGQAPGASPNEPVPMTANYLYEPNASVMKAGCFGVLSKRYGIGQLNPNSHLFVSASEVERFPGRSFAISRTTSMNKHVLKAALAGIDRANIAVRNFPLSVEQLRKKLKLKDGGDTFIFATTVRGEGHQLFICRKIG